MSNDNHSNDKRPSHIAYQVREGEDKKAYFNRIGAAWAHKDGEGFSIQLDSTPIDGRITMRSVKDRLQEARDNAEGGNRREEKRGSVREDRREAGPRYER